MGIKSKRTATKRRIIAKEDDLIANEVNNVETILFLLRENKKTCDLLLKLQ